MAACVCYSVWLRDGKCELWNVGSTPIDGGGKCVLRGTYEMCAAATKAAPTGIRPVNGDISTAREKLIAGLQ